MTATRFEALLAVPVSDADHIRGPVRAPVTLVEYGDYECPYCGAAAPIVDEVQQLMADRLRFVYRHFPITTLHPHAEQAAEAAEAAGAQDAFWEMHDLLFVHQDALAYDDLVGYARQLQLDVDAFEHDLGVRRYARRVARDTASAGENRVAGTPTFFIDGRRHYGAFDLGTLTASMVTRTNERRRQSLLPR